MADKKNQEKEKPQEQEKTEKDVKNCYACGLEFTGHGKTCSSACQWEFYA